jgi:hypothetical protein
MRPKVICLEAGCGNLTEYPPRCDEHSTHPAPPGGYVFPKARYDRAWKKLSAQLRAEQPWCSMCGSNVDLTVDHVLPGTTDGGVMVLCRPCNSRKSGQDRRLRRVAGTLP